MLISLKSEYDYLQSLCKILETIESLKGQVKVLGLADFNSLTASLKFIQSCQEQNIQPIVGVKVRTHDYHPFNLVTIYAKNSVGLQKLNEWYSEFDPTRETVSLKQFLKNNQDVSLVLEATSTKIESTSFAKISKQFFADDFNNYYFLGTPNLEIQLDKIYSQFDVLEVEALEQRIINIVTPLYPKKKDLNTYTMMQSIYNKNKYLTEKQNRASYNNKSLEAILTFEDKFKKATDKFLQSFENYNLNQGYQKTLNFEEYNNLDFEKLLEDRLNGLFLDPVQNEYFTLEKKTEYKQRLKLELAVIKELSFENYFLIMEDIIKFLKSEKIYYGEGRGSAPGSLVSFLLQITTVDPIEYGLYFERFLNKMRSSIPDIDLDVADDRRQEVVDYLITKYSRQHVGKIMTINTYLCKSLISDVGKSLEINEKSLKKISEQITSSKTFEENILDKYQFFSPYLKDPKFEFLREVIAKLEGLPRNSSIHAAGIIISSEPITKVSTINNNVVQSEAKYLEKQGYVKFDLLSLTTLSFVQKLTDKINSSLEAKVLDWNEINLNDKATFKNLSDAKTFGVFQLESAGVTNLIKRYQPQSVMDIGIVIALYRPGPMQNIDLFLENKKNPQKIKYDHPKLKEILAKTSGIIIFQEQIMDIVREIVGFTNQEADIFRVAISKKNKKQLADQREKFFNHGREKEISENILTKLYENIETFANYGFNKAHAIAYGKLIYKIMYLKTHYPNFFYTTLFKSSINSSKKDIFLEECSTSGLKIYAPSILKSEYEARINGKNILLGFDIIKGVARNKILNFILLRNKFLIDNPVEKQTLSLLITKGLFQVGFTSVEIENLVFAGAFREFKYNINSLLLTLEQFSDTQIDVLVATGEEITICEAEDLEFAAKNKGEFKALGFNLKYNAKDQLLTKLRHKNPYAQLTIMPPSVDILEVGLSFYVFAVLEKVKKIKTKNDETMAFIEVYTQNVRHDLTCFPEDFKRNNKVLVSENKGTNMIIKIKKNYQNKLICEEIIV